MKTNLTQNSEILIPNKEHKSFSGSNTYIPKNSLVEGEVTIVDGKKRGKDFTYRLFKTTKNDYILLNTINQNDIMGTEVKLGANGMPVQTPLVINTQSGNKFGTLPIVGTLLGALAGFSYAKHKKLESKKKYIFILGGALVGYVGGRLVQDRKTIRISEPTYKGL